MHDREIISALRLALANRIGQERFDLWFGQSCRLELLDNAVVVAVADQFSLDWVRNHFREDITAIVVDFGQQHLLPRHAQVKFQIDMALKRGDLAEKRGDLAEPVKKESTEKSTKTTSFQRKFASLDSFVVSDSSRIAHTSSRMVVERPGNVSPLFLYGPHGVGKTHLLEGIWGKLRCSRKLRRVVYLSAEQFTGYFLEALHGSGLPNFRRKYRDTELLIVDDVQFLVGKKATLLEFLHTIDVNLREGRQLVFAADRPPAELTELGADVIGRISSGLVCRLDSPGQEARRKIASQLAKQCHCHMPESVFAHIASNFSGDARLLRGAINRLKATSQALNKPVTLHMAEEALAEMIQSTCRAVRLNDIERAVCDEFGLDPKTLQSDRKAKSVSHPRMLAMWLARKYTRAAFSEIGHYFGRRSHSTVISAQKKVQRWLNDGCQVQLADRTWNLEDALERVENRLRTG